MHIPEIGNPASNMINGSCHIILAGHRGSGKSTIGRRTAASLGIPFYDLDEEIQKRTGLAAADWVREDESSFRAQELMTLGSLRMSGNGVIATGGGIRLADAVNRGLLEDAYIVWIVREGWEETARRHRARLMPGMTFEEEIRWMTETREPVFASYSDAVVSIERGCEEEEAAERLVECVADLISAAASHAPGNIWIVPLNEAELRRAQRLTALFPLGGIEIRSDLDTKGISPGQPYCASLRTAQASFLRIHSDADVFDIDLRYILSAELAGLQPRRIILSAHPDSADPTILANYREALNRFAGVYPDWVEFLEFKYAPKVESWAGLESAFAIAGRLVSIQNPPRGCTFLPRGKDWEWVRAMRFHSNPMNYISVSGAPDEGMPPALRFFLPYTHGAAPERKYAVIGDPIVHSIGSQWHMRRSRGQGIADVGYYNIRVRSDEAGAALRLLRTLGFSGLSVTSPLKQVVASLPEVENPRKLTAGNTLIGGMNGWILADTDEEGMLAALDELFIEGILPGTAAVFGAGGVSGAVVRALEKRAWKTSIVSAREGWGAFADKKVTLIVNAAGPGMRAYDHPPSAEVWLDLHYRGIAPTLEGVRIHRNGMHFYRSQAIAQRKLWGLE